MKTSISVFWSFILLFGCKETPKQLPIDLSLQEDIPWIHLDQTKDFIPGISLERAYEEYELEGGGEDIIVAVMDKPIALNHEDLENQIYTNVLEIPNNNIDDDNNGYIDDIHGWNFLGYEKYNFERYASYVYIRVIRANAKKFEGKSENDIDSNDIELFKKYQEAVAKQEKLANNEKLYMGFVNDAEEEYYTFIKTFAKRIPNRKEFTHGFLDSLKTRNDQEKELVRIMKRNLDWGYTFDFTFKDRGNTLIELFNTNNIYYNERANIGDDPYDYETIGYGNNNVDATSDLSHGTQVSGLIAATRNNGLGIRGISNNIKIMPLVVSPKYGHYNDKDLANAIRYAVDNGAKIINFSGNKDDTENEALLFSTLKYAENNGVLVITAAGNEGIDNDKPENAMYFSDTFKEDSVANLIRVGATTKSFGNALLANYSNYGKNTVDLFAPGDNIKTTDTRRLRYTTNSGTSLSTSITSGVAALIWSNYPNLTYKQIKHILMESGTTYDGLLVNTQEKDSVLFSDLSKSGKVLNAYNALKMAKEMDSIKKE